MRIRFILLPTDFAPTSDVALDTAATLAVTHHARVTVLHVYQAPGSYFPEGFVAAGDDARRELQERIQVALDACKQRLVAAGVPAADTQLVEGSPAEEILRVAGENFDLVIMATHGRTGLKHALLGSVAERVVRHCPCPVMTVRPRETTTP